MVLVAFRIESAGNVSVCHRELEFEFLTLISDVQIEAKSERSSDGHRRQCIKYVSHPDCVLPSCYHDSRWSVLILMRN
jgi:hypothetical protein